MVRLRKYKGSAYITYESLHLLIGLAIQDKQTEDRKAPAKEWDGEEYRVIKH